MGMLILPRADAGYLSARFGRGREVPSEIAELEFNRKGPVIARLTEAGDTRPIPAFSSFYIVQLARVGVAARLHLEAKEVPR
jgi:hypothetical protein